MPTLTIRHLAELPSVARAFLAEHPLPALFAFVAPMGSGKTTFITALCKEMGIEEVVNSPTFAIVNSYTDPSLGNPVYHIDGYRLKDQEEALQIGILDYLQEGNTCFIEWPEVFASLLPEDTIVVHIESDNEGVRTIHF